MLFDPQTTSDAPQSTLTSEWRSRKRGASEGSTCEEMLVPVLKSTVGKRFVKKHPYVPCSEVIHYTFISVPPALCTVDAEDDSPSSSPPQAATAARARSVSLRRGGQRWSSSLLLGTSDDPLHGPAVLRFRCGPASLGDGGGYCHQLNMPHYRNLRHVRLN